MASNLNLFPPIVSAFAPAFTVDSGGTGVAKINYSISKYNSATDIKSVWVSVSNQYTGKTMLKASNKTELLHSNFNENDLSISISSSDLEDGKWLLNQFYKIQIRFSSELAPEDPDMNWVINHQSSFSEWSTVSLVKAIQQPTLILKNFEDPDIVDETIFTSLNNTIVGQVIFNEEDNEELESYQIFLYNQNNQDVAIYDSGIVYTEASTPNEINHVMNYGLIDGEQYILKFKYTTKNQYTETNSFNFSVITAGGEILEATISATPEDYDGYISINVKAKNMEEKFIGNIVISRASIETNYRIWEDVYTQAFSGDTPLNLTWNDFTVESGVLYKYCAQKRTVSDHRGLTIQISDPVVITLHDMFLIRGDRRLKIEFNPKITSYKRILSDSVTQTIGGKYPFIKRNGYMNYRQFSISGLISHFCDEKNFFMNEKELYSDKEYFNKYNQEYRISEYNDFTLERKFREQVEDFLIKNNVKLFKSPAEGNILVRLTDVTLTPQEALGRMLYTFTATAHEIDECTIANYEKYQIQNVGVFEEIIQRDYLQERKYYGTLTDSQYRVMEYDFLSIAQEYENGLTPNGKARSIQFLTELMLDFQSKPYLIVKKGNEITPASNTSFSIETDEIILGYLIKINGQKIIVPASGQYSLKDASTKITDLVIYVPRRRGDKEDTVLSLSYTASIIENDANLKLPKQVTYSTRLGQLWGWINPNEDLVGQIKAKYNIENEDAYQELYALNKIRIEAEPNTLFYLQDESSDEYKMFEIGDTGSLTLEDSFNIKSLYCLGKRVIANVKDNIEDEWFDQSKPAYSYWTNSWSKNGLLDLVPAPVEHGVYRINDLGNKLTKYTQNDNSYLLMLKEMSGRQEDNYYHIIYEQGNWYFFGMLNSSKGDGVIIQPSQILIDYEYELERGSY